MNENQTILSKKINQEKRFLRRRIWLSWGLNSIALVLVPILIVSLFDKIWPFREHISFYILVSLILVALALTIKMFIKSLRGLPDERKIALMAEELCPELMDSLICSLELLQKKSKKLTSMNEALVHSTTQFLEGKNFHSYIQKKAPQTRKLASMFLILALILGGICILPYANKAFAYSRELLTGNSLGILVHPGDVEIGIGDDLKIEAEILRGPEKAEITILNREDKVVYEMYKQSDGKFVFETFSVNEDFSYFISTPIIKSTIFHIQTYTKPSITDCKIKITPPEYTQISPSILDGLKDFSVPQGSTVSFGVETNMPVSLVFVTNEKDPIPFLGNVDKPYYHEFQVKETLSFTLKMEDSKGRQIPTERNYRIESITDFSPLLQPITPEENAIRNKDAETSFSFKVTDDYGIQSVKLHYSISGSELSVQEIFLAEKDNPVKEKLAVYTLEFEGKVKDGDVIAYFGTASDYAAPMPNMGTSDVRFVEIRPETPKPNDQKQCGGGKIKKLSVSDLIIEQKHLIRSTWNLSVEKASDQRLEFLQDLAKSASDLHIESKRRLAKLKGAPQEEPEEVLNNSMKPSPLPTVSSPHQLPQSPKKGSQDDQVVELLPLKKQGKQNSNLAPEGYRPVPSPGNDPNELPANDLVGDLFRQALNKVEQKNQPQVQSLGIVGKLFEEAIENMARSEDFLKKNLPEESLPYQQRSLSNLVSIEIELEKNSVPSSGKGEEGEGESKPNEEIKEQNANKKKQEALALLKKLGNSLEKLIQKQENLNYEVSRSQENPQEEFLQFIENKQDEIKEETNGIRNELDQFPEAFAASKELREAARNMDSLISNLQNRQLKNSEKHGNLAHQFLDRGKQLLEELQDNLMGDKMSQANKMLQGIRKKQKELSDKTKSLSKSRQKNGSSQADVTQGQKLNRNSLEQFMKNLAKLANEMGDSNPEASRELSKAFSAATKANISGKMKRSENAVRYGRFERAMDYQKDTEKALEDLADSMQNAMNKRESLSNSELSQMLQKITQDANRLKKSQEEGAPPQAKEQLYSEINTDLMEVAKQLNDTKMDQVSKTLNVLARSSSSENIDQDILDLLYQSAGILERKLLESALKKKINLTHVSGQKPPDAYKKLVNQYFKNLSNFN